MKIIVVGLNYKTASLNIRENLAFDSAQSISALKQLKNRFNDTEFVLLSTCNRVELYGAGNDIGDTTAKELAKFLSDFHNVALSDFQDSIYVHSDENSVRHLLRVASSLDSMVVGEDQIIGQVKESFHLACAAKTTGKILNRLFHYAFSTSKKVHTTTSISSGRVSVAGIAVELAQQLFADFCSAKVLLIGAGQMGQLLVEHFLHSKCNDITVVNRTYQRGVDVARRNNIAVAKWEELENYLLTSNIVVASAATEDYLFTKNTFKKIMARRQKLSLLVIDIAVPRNFEPSINQIEDVYLYSIDDLTEVAEQNRKARRADIDRGMHIIHQETDSFMDWLRAKDLGPKIGLMKEKFTQISQIELERSFGGAKEDPRSRELTELMVNRIVNKLLHCVIKNLNVAAKEHGPAEAVKLADNIVHQAEEITGLSNKQDIQS